MKTMLITGASSGIGRALALRAARAGYAVSAVGRDTGALAALQTKIEAQGGCAVTHAVDITVPGSAREIVVQTLARFGSLDVLVNNAGFTSAGPLSAQSDAELQRQFATHVGAPVALVREALAALTAAQGHVFMVGSGVARVPLAGLGAYPAAKAATRSAAAILRRELRPLGIGLTYVDPGAVDTPFMRRAGMPGAPAWVLTSPEAVARKILLAVAKRPAELNAVPWQTRLVALAERFPRLTERLLERVPALTGSAPDRDQPTAAPASDPVALIADTEAQPRDADDGGPSDGAQIDDAAGVGSPEPSPFETALEPHRRRMERLKLSEPFVRGLLVPAARLELGDVALQWAGMPNKNERALTAEVLEALADAGFLERSGDGAYQVVRVA